MTKVLVLGGTGMLGQAVVKHFAEQPGYEVTATFRKSEYTFNHRTNVTWHWFDAGSGGDARWMQAIVGMYDYVINCIGLIKPFSLEPEPTIYVNSYFPHRLAKSCGKLIHISTDCVFSGLGSGGYVESSKQDATDLYGRSKAMGEPSEKAMVIRTSIIGEENHAYLSLVEWAKSQKGMTVNGFENWIWNGISTKQFAKWCQAIIENGWWETGVYHVFSSRPIQKIYLLKLLNDKYHLDLDIVPTNAPEPNNRSLGTEKDLITRLGFVTIEQMVEEM